MKTKLSILLLLAIAMVSAVSGQISPRQDYESIYFDREEHIHDNGDMIVCL